MENIRTLLVTGGARSGKSSFAQTLAEGSGLAPLLIATAQASDDEMRARIQRHQRDRNKDWALVEEPLAICDRINELCEPGLVLVVDCLTLWLANLMFAGADIEATTRRLSDVVAASRCPLIFVTNEVGSGIVPDNALARAFRDHQGRLNQSIARACERVVLVVSGYPLQVKPPLGAPIDF
ncbi:MAG: bifunctional adenosylcobinamide kinase/adenosylcobinamide-phosphate guanylyltransferase [Beijerinckiaceae bacterium]|nr:bifunctional adenosylcobinamide kinase/adenosylcobinamide-phosphate guanylyltransferase [Beijerinckiaceae bacterium]